MALEDLLGLGELNATNSSILEVLPPSVISGISSLITILKITGIIVIAYILLLIIGWIMNIKRHRKINRIYEKVEEMDRKLDILMHKKTKSETPKPEKEKKEKNQELKKEKKGFFKSLFNKKDEKKKEDKSKKGKGD